MGENTHACCCDHSEAALLKRIGELAAEYRGKEGSLIQVLHMAQGIYGYLPLEVQKVIADALDISLAEVSGVVTFYSFFSTQPRGEHPIRVCLGTACYVRGGKTLAKISALVASKSLDVVIGDQSAIDHYETVSAYQNLEELLSPELYERVKDHIYRAKDGEGNLTPVALSLEDTALGEKTGIIMDPPYLAVIQGSPHKEAAIQMIEYLFP